MKSNPNTSVPEKTEREKCDMFKINHKTIADKRDFLTQVLNKY